MISREATAGVVALLVMGVLAVLVELQSPSLTLWTEPAEDYPAGGALRWIEGACISVWFVSAAGVYLATYLHGRRRRRRRELDVVREAEAVLRRAAGGAP